MYASNGRFAQVDGIVDFSFTDLGPWPSTDWPATSAGGAPPRLSSIVFGDPIAGPMLTLWAVPTSNDDRPPAPAHSHGTDTLQVPVRGALHYAHRDIGRGQVRLARAGRPYGGERHSTRPEGAWTVEMMADRRGWPMRPVSPELAIAMRSEQARANERLRPLVPEVFAPDHPVASTLLTTVGEADRQGELIVSFQHASSWPIVGDCHLAAAALGDRDVGPIAIAVRAAPGAIVMPACSVPTDVMLLPLDGTMEQSGTTRDVGALCIVTSSSPLGPIAAGDDGADLLIVFGNRARSRIVSDDAAAQRWAEQLTAAIAPLPVSFA